MNVWIRIVSILDINDALGYESPATATIRAKLDLLVYRTKERASAAQLRAGGIILEVSARALSGISNEFGEDVLLIENDDMERDDDMELPVPTDTKVGIHLSCVSSGHTPNYGPFAPEKVEAQGDLMTFSDDEKAWLAEFQKESGFRLHQ